METDPDPTVESPPASPREGTPPGSGAMEGDATTVGTSGDPTSQPGSPRRQPRAPDTAHPSDMWFCSMPRCARREGASPTGWGCLQSLISHLRSVHLSAGSAPPDGWLQAHNLRVCLACQELSAVGSRCPGPRCSSAMLAALAAGNSAPRHRHALHFPGRPPGPGHPQLAGHAGHNAAQGTHCGLLQLRPGPEMPAAGRGTRADVGEPGPPSPLPPHRAGLPPRNSAASTACHRSSTPSRSWSPELNGLQQQTTLARGPGPGRRQPRPRTPRLGLRTEQRRPSGPSWPKGHLVGPSSC